MTKSRDVEEVFYDREETLPYAFVTPWDEDRPKEP